MGTDNFLKNPISFYLNCWYLGGGESVEHTNMLQEISSGKSERGGGAITRPKCWVLKMLGFKTYAHRPTPARVRYFERFFNELSLAELFR